MFNIVIVGVGGQGTLLAMLRSPVRPLWQKVESPRTATVFFACS